MSRLNSAHVTSPLSDPVTPEQLYTGIVNNLYNPIRSGIVIDEDNIASPKDINNIADIPNKGNHFVGHWFDLETRAAEEDPYRAGDFFNTYTDMTHAARQKLHTRRSYNFTIKYTEQDVDGEIIPAGDAVEDYLADVFNGTRRDINTFFGDRRDHRNFDKAAEKAADAAKNIGIAGVSISERRGRLRFEDMPMNVRFTKSQTFEKPRGAKFIMSNIKGSAKVSIASSSTRSASFNYVISDNSETITVQTYTTIHVDDEDAGLREGEYVLIQGTLVCLYEQIL